MMKINFIIEICWVLLFDFSTACTWPLAIFQYLKMGLSASASI